MKRYRMWALGVPDLHPDGFQPRLGGMRLFEGGDSGGDGPGGSDTRDENASDYSPSGSGGVDYEALAEASRIAAGATAMNDAKAAAEIADAMKSMGYTPYVSDTAAQGAAAQDLATRAAELAALGIDINDPFAGSYQGPVTRDEVAALPEDVEAKSNLDRLEEELQDAMAAARLQTYYQTLDRGGSRQEADDAADKAANDIYFAARGLGSDSPGQREEYDPGYIGGPADVLGDVSGLGVDRPAYDTGRGTVFEDVTRPSGEGVVSVDVAQEEALGPPPPGFTGPSLSPTPGDVDDDRADQMFEWAAGNVPARQGAWQVDEQGRVFTIDERGVRMSPSGVALDPEEERWGSTPAREPAGALPGAAQSGTPSGALPGPSGGALSVSGDLYDGIELGQDIFQALDAINAGQALTQNLSFLVDRGYGAQVGINPNNPTQSVQEMLNSARLGDFLDRNMPSIIGMTMGPVAQIATEAVFAMKKGYQPSSVIGMIVSSIIGSAVEMATGVKVPGQAVQDLAQGNIGKAAFGVGVSNVAARMGVPVGTVNSVLRGDLGGAAANQILSEVVNESAKQMGADPGLIAMVAVRSGLGQGAFDKIASAINDNSIVKGVNDILGDWSSKITGITADAPIGEAVTGGGTSVGALPGQDTYYTSDGGTDGDQTGALPDTTVSGQPKKRIPRWSDLFLGNLARDLSTGFAATPPPAGVPPEDDLNAALDAAEGYLGGGGQFVDESSGNSSDRRALLAEYIRYMAESGDAGFRVNDDGTLSIIDPDLNVTHRFSSDGAAIGSTNYVQIGGPGERTSQAVSDLLGTDYLQSLFGNRQDLIYSQQVSAENRDRLTEEQYRALFQTGESAAPPATGSGQAVFGSGSGSFGSKADALSLFPGLSLRERDTDGNEIHENQGFIVYASSDGSVSAVRKDAPDMTPVELYRPPETPTTPTTDPAPVLRPEDMLRPGDQVTAPTSAEREQTEATAPTTPPIDTQQPSTTPSTDVTQGGSTVTPTMTSDQVRQVVQEAMAANPGLTETQVQQIVNSALQGLPQGLTTADVSSVVNEAISSLPAAPTTQDINNAVSAAMAGVVTQQDLQQAIAGIQFPAGLTESDVTRAITDYMRQNPGLSPQDVAEQVGQQLRQLPAYATPADVESAIQGALTNVATRADVAAAIGNIQFPAGITEADVTRAITDYMTQNPGLSAQDVAQQVGDQLRQLPAYATPADVQSAINNALTGVATQADVAAAIAGIQFPAGITSQDVTNAISQYMQQNPGLSAADVAGQVAAQLATLPAYATPADVDATVRQALAGYATGADLSALSGNLEAVRAELSAAIAGAREQGLSGDSALAAGLEDLASQLGTTREGLVQSLGVTESALRSEFATQIGGVQTQIAGLQEGLQKAIADARAAGVEGDDALRLGLESVAQSLGTTREDLLSTMGKTEEALRGEFATQLSGVSSQIADVQSQLLDKIAAAQAAGLEGDAALGASLASLAADLGTTQAGLLAQLGTTEQALRTDFGTLLGGVQGQVDTLGRELRAAIEDARAGGLQGDAALQAGLGSLAADLGTTKEALLSQLGQTEQGLRADFAAQLGGLQEQFTGLGGDLAKAIEAARAAGLEGDAALQAGLDSLASTLGTTKDSLLAELGQTEQSLRSQFETALGGVQTTLSEQLAGLQGEAQAQYEAMTASQKQEVEARVAQGERLSQAISDVQSGLSGQIAGLQRDVDAQYAALTASQQAEVQSRVQQGESLSKAITDVQSGLTGAIAGVEAGLTGQIGGLRQEVSDQYRLLSDAQKAEVQNRVQQGEDLSRAIAGVQSGLSGEIAGVREGLTGSIEGLREETSQQYRSLTDAQKSEVNARVAMGQNLESAIASLGQQTQSSISSLGADLQSSLLQAMQQNTEAQTKSDLATLDYLLRLETQQQESAAAAAQAQQEAAAAAAQAQEEEAARQAERARLQLNLQQQQGALQSAASFGAAGSRAASAADPYKATFKDPFIVGGEAPEFKSALAGFLGSAMTSSFLPDVPTADGAKTPDRLGSEYFGSAAPAGSQGILDMYSEAPYEGLYGFKAGGMVPLMAQGGTRHGNNAHGALRVLEHSGKHRVDYRQGDAVTGIGDGQSDDIPAMLADGEFVFPADVVAALGNGSTKAGSDKLYEMMHNIRRHHRSTGPKDLPPPAKSPLEYIKSRKGRR